MENRLHDETGEALTRRKDDNPESLKERLVNFHNETEPIISRYSPIHTVVDGKQKPDEVWKDIQAALAC